MASIGVILVVVGLCGAALADLVSLVEVIPSAASSAPVDVAPMSYAAPAPLEICAGPAPASVEMPEKPSAVAQRSGGARHVAVRHRSPVDVLPDAVASLEAPMNDAELGSATLRDALDRIH